MLSKSDIKRLGQLSHKKYRDENGLFVVEGAKLVAEALASGFEIVERHTVDDIGEQAMSRITLLSTPSPDFAVVRRPLADSGRACVDTSALTLALDGLRDPGNVGTIIRLADWFGVRHIIASPDTVDIYNPKVVQATMGAIFRVKFSYCPLPDVLKGLDCPVYGTYMDGENIYDAALAPRGVIVMGSEANGISPEVGALVSRRLTIPAFNPGGSRCESLNVAIASAIVCSEFRRR